mmetsp:Transcript_8600/g.25903  ORF Transcript_8600/g.25903 Transcript_8600/m.25903 type:complete len:243 (+) Transcript_8600:925-1653(+)
MIATFTSFLSKPRIRSIILLSLVKCFPSSYSVPSASKVASLREPELAWIWARFRMCLTSAKLGGTNRLSISEEWPSYSLNALTRSSSVRKTPTCGTSFFSLLCFRSLLCSSIQPWTLVITSMLVCVLCMEIIKSMRWSCSFSLPFLRRSEKSSAPSEAWLATSTHDRAGARPDSRLAWSPFSAEPEDEERSTAARHLAPPRRWHATTLPGARWARHRGAATALDPRTALDNDDDDDDGVMLA